MKGSVISTFAFVVICSVISFGSCWCHYGYFDHTNDVHEVNYSPDGSLVVIASKDNNHYIYNAKNFQIVHPYVGPTKANSAKFSPDGNYIAFGLQNNSVVILDSSYNPTAITSAFGIINEVHFSANSDKLIVCGESGNNGYQIFAVPGWNRTKYNYTFTDAGESCRFANDGHYAVGSKDGYVRYYDSGYNQVWFNRRASDSEILALDFSPNSSYLFVSWANNNRKLGIFNVNSNISEYNVSTGWDSRESVDWSEDGTLIAIGGVSNKIEMFNGTQQSQWRNVVETYAGQGSDVHSVDYSYDSQWLVAGIKNNSVVFYKRDCSAQPLNPQQHCPAEYYQDTTTSCRLCALDMVGCRMCTDATFCEGCSDQYHLDTTINKCILCLNSLTACVLCETAAVCRLCLSTYYLNGGICSSCETQIEGCLTCNSSSYCSKCRANTHFLDTANFNCSVCVSSFANCLYCDSTSCLLCQKNFFLETNGSCSRCSLNCSSCSISASNCDSCDIGYYLTTSQCLPCVGPCSTCSSSTSCLSCQQSLYLSGTSCLFCDPGCSLCSTSSSNCHACDSGYYLSGSTCSACTSGCLSCSNSTNCLSCGVGSFLNASSCLSCTVLDSECFLCSNTGCLQCSSGHSLNGSTCVGCLSLVPGCQVCEGSTCLFCLREFFVESGSCSPCPFPCLTCSSNSSCLACPLGYFLDGSSQCQQCPCPTCSSNSTCLSCDLGWHLSGGLCLECSSLHSHCSVCSDSTTCLSCASPYFLSGLNCVLCPSNCTNCNTTSCLSCDLGSFLNSGVCESCSSLCSSCVSLTNCSLCVPGYYLSPTYTCLTCSSLSTGCLTCDSSICYSCDYSNGYFLDLTSSLCLPCSGSLPDCRQCLNSSVCSVCGSSFALNTSSQCQSCGELIPFCQTCSNSSSCSLCTTGFYPSGGVCLSCSNGCLSCLSPTVCTKCFNEFYLDSSGSCVECASVLTGCQGCSSNSTCTSCHFGYFLDTGGCSPCLASINGCLHCFNSSSCMSCESGFYLASLMCLSCSVNLTGCGFCRSGSLCDQCQMGYYLDSSNQCQFCLDSGCLTCNSSSCLQCLSGYYLASNGSCVQCLASFNACLFCNSSDCFRCQTGHFLNAMSCSVCPDANCELCNSSLSTQCLHCNSGFFESGGLCLSCNSSVTDCISCSSTSVCTDCQPGFYLLTGGSQCLLCSSVLPFCRSCLTSSVCLACNNGLILVNSSCLLCSSFIEGCALCQVSSICQSCLQGYYLNSTTKLCQRCGDMKGCLICRDSSDCRLCESGYFLQSGLCQSCSSTLPMCTVCSSSSQCILCQGSYQLQASICQLIQIPNESTTPYQELSLTSRYINKNRLSHTLSIQGSQFTFTSSDLALMTNISYVGEAGLVVYLGIVGYQWGNNFKSVVFYTDNPFTLQGDGSIVQKMSLFNVRRLEEISQGHSRLLKGPSMFKVNANFIMNMNETSVAAIMPTVTQGGGFSLSYNINQPQFVASVQQHQNYYYHFFGQFLCIYLLIFYFIKAVIIRPEGRDKGQIIAHILMLKTPALMLYPSYAQLISYCYGFMAADMPWMNSIFSDLLSDSTDNTPTPYLLFYTSLSITSTYLLPLMVILGIIVCLGIFAYLCEGFRDVFKNMAWFFYNYFIGGLAFAAVICAQGALMNTSRQFAIESAGYILGILILVCLSVQALYSSWYDINSLFKVRIILKVTFLSLMHFNPLYLFSLVLGLQAFFLFLTYKLINIRHKTLWLYSNILPNLALSFLVYLSYSLAAIYVASVLICGTLIIQFVILYKEYEGQRILKQIGMGDREVMPQYQKKLKLSVAKKEADIGSLMKISLQTLVNINQNNQNLDKNEINPIKDTFFILDQIDP